LRWRILRRTFISLSTARADASIVPLQWVVGGSLVAAAALITVEKVMLGIDIWMTAAAIVLSIPLMLVGLRVLGETNWGPISSMSNMMQAIFAFFSPGNVPVNMSSRG